MKQRNKRLRPYFRQFYKGNLGILVVQGIQSIVMVASVLMGSWLIQVIIDLTTGMDVGFTLLEVAGLVVLAVGLEGLSSWLDCVSRPRFIAKALNQYQNYVYERLIQKNISAFNGENSSVYVSALSNDAVSIENGYLQNILVILKMSLLLVGTLSMMFWYNPILTVVSIVLSALPMVAAMATGNLVAKAEREVSQKNEGYMSMLRDSLSGFSVIKSFRAELQMCRLYAREVRGVTDAKERRKKAAILVQGLSGVCGSVVQFGVFLLGAYLALSGSDISAGSVLVFVQLLNFVLTPVEQIPQALTECRASLALIAKLDDALSANIRDEGTVAVRNLTDGIDVSQVTFGYEPGKTVLDHVSFRFEAGKSYCLVGASGSGKSTLLNLLMAANSGFDGKITYDGIDVHDMTGESLYDLVSVVQQNVFVFNASIRENITMFRDFPKEEVDRAIQLSGLSALIAQRGEDYSCGENGSGLSGGEKQRISIARSLLKKSQVLLVDEATAALDSQTACQVSSAILGLEGMTRIVVTHALEESLLSQYDCILAMKNGRIIESGSFRELIDRKGYFYSLYTVSQ